MQVYIVMDISSDISPYDSIWEVFESEELAKEYIESHAKCIQDGLVIISQTLRGRDFQE